MVRVCVGFQPYLLIRVEVFGDRWIRESGKLSRSTLVKQETLRGLRGCSRVTSYPYRVRGVQCGTAVSDLVIVLSSYNPKAILWQECAVIRRWKVIQYP